ESNAGHLGAVKVPDHQIDPAGLPAPGAALANCQRQTDVLAGGDGDLDLFVHLGDFVPDRDDLGLGTGVAEVAVFSEAAGKGEGLDRGHVGLSQVFAVGVHPREERKRPESRAPQGAGTAGGRSPETWGLARAGPSLNEGWTLFDREDLGEPDRTWVPPNLKHLGKDRDLRDIPPSSRQPLRRIERSKSPSPPARMPISSRCRRPGLANPLVLFRRSGTLPERKRGRLPCPGLEIPRRRAFPHLGKDARLLGLGFRKLRPGSTVRPTPPRSPGPCPWRRRALRFVPLPLPRLPERLGDRGRRLGAKPSPCGRPGRAGFPEPSSRSRGGGSSPASSGRCDEGGRSPGGRSWPKRPTRTRSRP